MPDHAMVVKVYHPTLTDPCLRIRIVLCQSVCPVYVVLATRDQTAVDVHLIGRFLAATLTLTGVIQQTCAPNEPQLIAICKQHFHNSKQQ